MKKMKKLIAGVSMVMVLGLGAPAAFADGPKETPGRPGPQETTTIDTGSPLGGLMIDIVVYLATRLS
jgi:hypothetical protein